LVTFCSFFIKLFTNHVLLVKGGWFYGTCVKIWCFMKELWQLLSRFFEKKKGGKSWILGKHGVNVGFYKVKPHIFQKFSFFFDVFPRKKHEKSVQSSFIKHRIFTQVPKNHPPSTSKTNFAEDFLAKKWKKKQKRRFLISDFQKKFNNFYCYSIFFSRYPKLPNNCPP